MKTVARVAVRLPIDTLKSLERVRQRLKRTRSAVVAEALRRWLDAAQLADGDQRYVKGYVKTPEATSDAEAVAAVITARWSPWQ